VPVDAEFPAADSARLITLVLSALPTASRR
jgi:hypothetical protein